jgi:hypothetical protein
MNKKLWLKFSACVCAYGWAVRLWMLVLQPILLDLKDRTKKLKKLQCCHFSISGLTRESILFTNRTTDVTRGGCPIASERSGNRANTPSKHTTTQRSDVIL